MAELLDYSSVVEEVDSASNTEAKETVVNPTVALNDTNETKPYDYGTAISSIESVEGRGVTEIRPEQRPSTGYAPAVATKKGVTEATEEIEKLVSTAGKELESTIKKETGRIKANKLILPSLSLQDQVSDLEKMSEGLDEKVFSDEQLEIVRMEVEGLSNAIKYAKQETGDEFQQHLTALRDQRLNEVIAKLASLKNA